MQSQRKTKRNDHRHTDRLVEALELGNQQVVFPAIREIRKARTQEHETAQEHGIGERTHRQLSAGQTGAGRGRVHKKGGGADDESTGDPRVGEEPPRKRAMVARCNVLRYDQPDIQFVAEEASRWMSRPCRTITISSPGSASTLTVASIA